MVDGRLQFGKHLVHALPGHLTARGGRVAAAAQLLQNDLHVGLAHGATGDVHPLAVSGQHEGGVDADDVQQFIGGLSGGDTAHGGLGIGDGDVIPVEIGVLDDGIFTDGVLEVVLIELLHLGGISARAAQEGGSFKGASAGAHGEVLGVQHDAGQQRLRLGPKQLIGLHDVLQKLGDQLRGGGGVGLVVIERRPLNVSGCTAVMVDDRHPVAGLEYLGRLHLLGSVGVHHHHQRAAVGNDQRVLGAEEAVLVLRQLAQPLGQLLGGMGGGRLDDMGGNAVFPAQGKHARRRAYAVVIGHLMSHDEHTGGVGDQGGQGVGHHAAFDLGALLRLLGAAAVELEGVLIADDRLVAAPGQGHIQRQVGKTEQLLEAVAVLADADGQAGIDAAGVDHGAHRVQHVELLLDELLQILLLKDEQIALTLIAAQQTAGARHPGVQTGVDFGQKVRPLVIRQVLHHQILVVVDDEDGCHRPGCFIHVPDLAHFAHIHPVGGGYEAAAAAPGAGKLAKNQIPPAAEGDLVGMGALALHDPAGLKAGDDRRQLALIELVAALLAGELEKTVVGPDDLAALRAEHEHGQRSLGHGVLGGNIHAAGHVIQILADLPAAAASALPVIQRQRQNDHKLSPRHGQGITGHQSREENQHDKIDPQIALQKLIDFSVHANTLLSMRCIPFRGGNLY